MSTTFCQSTTEEAAKDVFAFIAIFLEHFTHIRGNKLHLAGESYGVIQVLACAGIYS